jgi:hypothetical protein
MQQLAHIPTGDITIMPQLDPPGVHVCMTILLVSACYDSGTPQYSITCTPPHHISFPPLPAFVGTSHRPATAST